MHTHRRTQPGHASSAGEMSPVAEWKDGGVMIQAVTFLGFGGCGARTGTTAVPRSGAR
jgi:hypothetical protein